MHSELLIAIGAGLGGMLGWGFADFFAKKTIDQIGDIVSLVWAHVFGTCGFVILALCHTAVRGQAFPIPSDAATWAMLVLFGIIQAAVYLLVYKGFAKGQLVLLNPVFASFSGLTAILSTVLFGEAINFIRSVALLNIFGGVLLISVDLQELKSRRFSLRRVPGLAEIVVATGLAAMWTLLWDQFVGGKDWLSYALFMYAFMTIAIVIFAKIRRIGLAVGKLELWKYLVLIGFCETGAYLAISWGYSETSLTSIVAVLSGAFSLPVILLARVFIKEKTTAVQTIGSLAIVAGIMLLPWR